MADMEPAGPDRARLRISDEDRHRVAEVLREAAGDGRIDLGELDERLDAAYAAKTYADLVPLTADLPVGAPATHPASAPNRAPVRGSRHVAIMSGFEGVGIMGGYSGPSDRDDDTDFTTDSPTVRIRGFAIMGGVDVKRKEVR